MESFGDGGADTEYVRAAEQVRSPRQQRCGIS